MKKVLFVLSCLFSLFLVFMVTVDRLVGMYLDPRLETTLTELFGMSVSIQDLRVNPFSGFVRASRLTFMNQPEFADKPHLDVEGLHFDIDLLALREHQVKIKKIYLQKPFYFIDRVVTPEGPRNNVKTWFLHIKQRVHKAKPKEGTKQEPSSPWKVQIGRIQINDGTFIYHDRSGKGTERKLVFKNFKGYLSKFEWPTADPSYLSQGVRVKGHFGESYSAPFWIDGFANFATRRVGFDLNGEIRRGRVIEHRGLWEGLPVEIVDGEFDLKSHTVCFDRELESDNELVLDGLKLKAGSGAADKIWGYPLKGWIAFLQDQQTVRLEIRLRGDIADPKFKLYHAFQQSFQDGLKKKSQSGFRLLTSGAGKLVEGTQKIATQTPQLVLDTPGKIVGGLGKMTAMTKSSNEEKSEKIADENSTGEKQ